MAIAKRKGKVIAIAFKSDNYHYHNSWKNDNFRKETKEKMQRNYSKTEAKRLRVKTLQGAVLKSLIL